MEARAGVNERSTTRNLVWLRDEQIPTSRDHESGELDELTQRHISSSSDDCRRMRTRLYPSGGAVHAGTEVWGPHLFPHVDYCILRHERMWSYRTSFRKNPRFPAPSGDRGSLSENPQLFSVADSRFPKLENRMERPVEREAGNDGRGIDVRR